MRNHNYSHSGLRPFRSRRLRKKPSIWKKLFLLAAVGMICYLLFVAFKFNRFYQRINTSNTAKTPLATKPPEEKTVYNILLLGYGGAGHDGAYLTDTMMVIHVDLKKNKAVLISLPRDIWVKIPTKSKSDFHEKVNAIYQMGLFNTNYPDIAEKYSGEQGAANLVKETVGSIVGLPIDNYVAINFEGFKQGVDLLGGIDVDVELSFDDYEYPVDGKEKDLCGKEEKDLPELEKIATESPTLAFPCRYEHLHFDKGMTHMDGNTALKYVRSRHSLQDGNDFGRAARQQRFLQAVKYKVLTVTFIPKIVPLLDEMQKYVKMDISGDDIKKFLVEASKQEQYEISSIVPSDRDYLRPSRSSYGGFILIPRIGEDRWEGLHKFIKNTIAGIKPSPTPVPTFAPTSAVAEEVQGESTEEAVIESP